MKLVKGSFGQKITPFQSASINDAPENGTFWSLYCINLVVRGWGRVSTKVGINLTTQNRQHRNAKQGRKLNQLASTDSNLVGLTVLIGRPNELSHPLENLSRPDWFINPTCAPKLEEEEWMIWLAHVSIGSRRREARRNLKRTVARSAVFGTESGQVLQI